MSLPNFNIGILGHVDSGKTTLAKTLSQVASTACFDKHPQSKERGITLDLGFSSFTIPRPTQLPPGESEEVLVTLVDCPGHASLLKTVIGGAQIIDLVILVVDINKGIQTQTAECLIIGELTCDKIIVVLNKTDMIPDDKKEEKITKVSKKISLALSKTKFKGCPIIPCSAGAKEGIGELAAMISNNVTLRNLDKEEPGDFIFAVDHCFGIRGQGTILTGTCLSGMIHVNDTVMIDNTKIERKIKSIQVFRRSVNQIRAGDRAGVCVSQFDPKLLERGLVFTGHSVKEVSAVIIDINKVAYYKGGITNKMKFHVSIGHETVLARITFFKTKDEDTVRSFSLSSEYLYQDTINPEDTDSQYFGLLELEHSVLCVPHTMVIISRLDMDINTPACRLAFHGTLQHAYTNPDYLEEDLEELKIFRLKGREGVVERMSDGYTVIGRELFKKETNIEQFCGLSVQLSTGEVGKIEGSFGQSGKFKVYVTDGLTEWTKGLLESRKKKGGSSEKGEKVLIHLKFKRYIFDKKKRMIQ